MQRGNAVFSSGGYLHVQFDGNLCTHSRLQRCMAMVEACSCVTTTAPTPLATGAMAANFCLVGAEGGGLRFYARRRVPCRGARVHAGLDRARCNWLAG
jgi:hypothetical protein